MAILRMPGVKAKYGKCVAAVYNDIRDGLFTEPVLLGQRSVGWPEQEVESILLARIAGSTDEELRVLVAELHARRVAGTGKPFVSWWQPRHRALCELEKKRKKPTRIGAV